MAGTRQIADTSPTSDDNPKFYSGLEKNGISFKVHKAIVCTQSVFFANACRLGAFKAIVSRKSPARRLFDLHLEQEGFKNQVNLEAEDPETVRAVLQFIYTSKYKYSTKVAPSPNCHAILYAAADFFKIESLKIHATHMFKAHLEREEYWNADGFSDTLRLVYENTSPEKCGLRRIIAEQCAQVFSKLFAKSMTNWRMILVRF
ncbi:hypothetical protein EJ08DRAFT_737832 [Tothia fuscella]|uniref:BTB domain-containing protein n=1 Tax=Tothia fuscella TaxID=1048955 RepID=A0A9P4NIP0_9PEZI|nr:hypothetical protein EJ08DRAFT_737832 [Tothia fuscella]